MDGEETYKTINKIWCLVFRRQWLKMFSLEVVSKMYSLEVVFTAPGKIPPLLQKYCAMTHKPCLFSRYHGGATCHFILGFLVS